MQPVGAARHALADYLKAAVGKGNRALAQVAAVRGTAVMGFRGLSSYAPLTASTPPGLAVSTCCEQSLDEWSALTLLTLISLV